MLQGTVMGLEEVDLILPFCSLSAPPVCLVHCQTPGWLEQSQRLTPCPARQGLQTATQTVKVSSDLCRFILRWGSPSPSLPAPPTPPPKKTLRSALYAPNEKGEVLIVF